jgi:hypothetical protein
MESIDKKLLTKFCKDDNLKNLIHLSSQNDINIFNKKWQLKSKDKLLKECEQIKKKEIKTSSFKLSNLAKLNENNISSVNEICNNLQQKIVNIDKIVSCINNINTKNEISIFTGENIPKISESSSDYIECFSNC